jgi:hypothetical protein
MGMSSCAHDVGKEEDIRSTRGWAISGGFGCTNNIYLHKILMQQANVSPFFSSKTDITATKVRDFNKVPLVKATKILDMGVSRFAIHSPGTQQNALVSFWWQEKVGCRPILPYTHLS